MEESSLNHGIQPLDELMLNLKLTNKDLVDAVENLTFKMVKKARGGRQLTLRIQHRVLQALQARTGNQSYVLSDLFTYRGN